MAGAFPMSVTLLSNIPHYHYLAQALHQEGILDRYVTANTLLEGENVPRFLSPHWKRKLEGRRLTGVPGDKVSRLRIPELLQRGLPMLGLLSAERGNWLNNELFDRLATRFIEPSPVLHFVSSIGLHCARKAKQFGATIVCDVRQEHPAFQRQILEEESAKWNVAVHITGKTYEDRVIEEFDLADYLVVPSGHARNTFTSRAFPSDRVAVLPYGVDLEMFGPTAKPDSTFRVIFAGSVTLRKGIQYLLEAWRRLRLADAELVIVGGIHPNMQPILQKYEGLFRHVPAIPKLQLRDYYGASSVFVLPSLADSFSLATLEAMACGLPVIISENTGAADLIAPGVQGWVLPIRDVDRIAHSLSTLHRSPDLRIAMAQAARTAVRDSTWEHYAAKAQALHRRILGGSSMLEAERVVPDAR